MALIAGAIALGASAYDSYSTQSSAKRANKTNVRLQREQQTWEERMSNTAVQRRADDIERAGGNRALAFVNGSEASTPSIQPARTEPVESRYGHSLMTGLQVANLKSVTEKNSADARVANVEARIREGLYQKEFGARANAFTESVEQQDITTELLRNKKDLTALQAQQLRQTVDSIVTQAKQAAEKGDLEIKQLRNIVNVGGLTSEDKDSVLRYLIDVLLRGK